MMSLNFRMKIEEENINDYEDKVELIKSERTVKTNGAECPKQRINNDICYCDRAPGPSRNIATKPHVKTSYCVDTESNKAATAEAVTNKSNEKITRNSSVGNKLSPVAKDIGSKTKTCTSQGTRRKEDISMIFPESFTRPRSAEDSLKKSIFSCISAPRKAKASTVIIEELPNDEICEKSKVMNSTKTKAEIKRETGSREEKNTPIQESCINKNKKLSSAGKKSVAKMNSVSNKIETINKDEKSNKINDSREVNIERKKKTSFEKEKNALTEKSGEDENKNAFSPEKESKTKTSSLTSNKKCYSRNEFHKESCDRNLQMNLEV